ncbi:homocysteine S-methyltransferase family protein, partial [Elusimicrobiota bacterium]
MIVKKNSRIIFLDGAMGTSLSKRGIDPTPAANIEHPLVVRDISIEYIEAGCDIIQTNTFSANPYAHSDYRRLNRQ